MDRTDKKILAELQLNGRLSITELAEKVGLSISPCHRPFSANSVIDNRPFNCNSARIFLSVRSI
jgi:hypothetical protein